MEEKKSSKMCSERGTQEPLLGRAFDPCQGALLTEFFLKRERNFTGFRD